MVIQMNIYYISKNIYFISKNNKKNFSITSLDIFTSATRITHYYTKVINWKTLVILQALAELQA